MIVNVCLFLGVALVLAHLSREHRWAAAGAVLAAVLAGTLLPDLDAVLQLGHRSGLTHSVLPAALVGWWRRHWLAVAAGLALGIGLHLSADLFPHAMRGFALIKLPGLHGIGAGESYAWIGVNAAAALAAGAWATARVVPQPLVAAVLAGAGVIGLSYLTRTDGGWWAMALLLPLGWLALRPYRRASAHHAALRRD